MKKLTLLSLLVVGITVQTDCATIIESKDIVDVLVQAQAHDPQSTLIIFDIDNTVAAPYHDFGSDQWFYHTLASRTQRDADNQGAKEKLLPVYFALQHAIALHPVEITTPYVIRILQSNKFAVMALTARSVALCHRTIHQLNAMHVDFSLSAPRTDDGVLATARSARHQAGVIFCNGDPKEEVLEKFLALNQSTPKTIIFVDDKLHYIHALERFTAQLGIEFVGIHYRFCDDRVNGYNAAIAEQQLQEHLNHHQILLEHLNQ